MTINFDEIVDNFGLMDGWEDRYAYLIDLGDLLPPMAEAAKTESARVPGCMSQVWMLLGWDDAGRLTMLADSDARIVRGLIALLYAIFSGKRAAEISATDVAALFAQLGLDQHLSPNRRNGFFAMVERIQEFAARTA